MDVRIGPWRRLRTEELMLLNYGAGEDSWGSLGLQGDQTSPSERKSTLNIHWKYWSWSWSSNTLATWCEELTLEKTLMLAKFEGRRRRGRQRTRWLDHITNSMDIDWANSGKQWRTGKPGMLQSMGSQKVRHNLATEQQQQLEKKVKAAWELITEKGHLTTF